MDQQDKIAHLNELAQEHFNEGNLSAAMNAWQQVLELDSSNADAQRGLQLARQKSGGDENPLGGGPFDEAEAEAGADGDGGPFDADATMMFTPGSGAPPAGGSGGDDEGEATMMFNPGSSPSRGGGAEADDADATMMFTPGASSPDFGLDSDGGGASSEPDDADATMMFNPGSTPSPGRGGEKAGGSSDEGEATMMFRPDAGPPDLGPGHDADENDADATMMFTPGSMPSPGEEAAPDEDSGGGGLDFGLPSEVSSSDDADQTMMSPEGSDFDLGGSDEAPPPPPPPRPEKPSPPELEEPSAPAADDGGLEDFELPSGGLEMAGPPSGDSGGVSLPDAPPPSGGDSGGGFSFDLPPAGAPPESPESGGSSPGGDFNLPELPSLGPPPPSGGAPEPPSMAPPPPPPPAPGGDAPQPSGQFGEVDPGEIENLAVPTVGGGGAEEEEPEPEENLSEEEIRRREEEKAAEYAAMYGRSEGGAAPAPSAGGESFAAAPAGSAIPWKLLIPLGLVVVVVVGAIGGFLYINKPETTDVVEIPRPETPPEPERTPAEWRALHDEAIADLEAALEEGNLDEAVTHAAAGRDTAAKAELAATPRLDELMETLQFEQAWEAKLRQAIDFFCVEQYEDAIGIFDELRSTKLGDPRPDEYISRIYFNLAIIELQALRPWDAVWPFEQALERTPGDEEAQRLKAFAEAFPRGTQLIGNYDYTSVVDPLVFRKAGCS